MSRAAVVVVAGLVAVALVLGSALSVGLVLRGGPDPDTRETRTAEPIPVDDTVAVPPDADLAPYYRQKLDWKPCRTDDSQDCARLTVPIDYTRPLGDTFEVAVLRVPARGTAIGAMVVNPGGPGAPGTSFAAAARRVFSRDLTANLDVVGFDPRGTGRSNPVDCLADAELDDYLAQDPDPDTLVEREVFETAQQDFFAGCVARSDGLLGHVTTIETARDLDVLRAALGQSTLTYFGASYGTKLGATYAELFPERVGRLVLDGAVDVSLPSRELSLEQAAGFETALRAYVTNCVENVSGCFLGDTVDGGIQMINDLLASLEDDPLPTGDDGRVLTRGLGFYGVVTPLYNRESWPFLDQGLRTALGGDGTTLLVLADLYSSREGGTYTNNSTEAILAINCLDDPYSVAAEEVPDQLADFTAASPTFGPALAWGLVACEGITVESSEPPLEIDGSGAAPILVVGTTRDPATPYEWAVSLADQLDSGVLLTRDGDGHTGYNAGNECIDSVIEDYLLDGDVPQDGLTC